MFSNQTQNPDLILVVDDAPDNLFLIQTALESDGYETELAEDGKTALTKVEKLLPNLILLDIMMPEMDGYEITERIRNHPTLPYIPILLITADEQSSVVKGLDSGADDFIRKPVDLDELLARVRCLLRLKHSIDEQEKMVRQREDFVSRLTHDLRTPLLAADRMFSLFQQGSFGTITSEMNEAVDSMSRNNRNLLQLVNTLLEVYRHDAGNKKLEFDPCNLEALIHEVVEELSPLAHRQDLTLSIKVDKALHPGNNPLYPKGSTIMADRLELQRVFTNLIGNAIKFTDEGGIEVRLIETVKPSPDWVTIEIKDTGVGIALEDQANLFERFRPGVHKHAGSGLGLYLSRRIVESHQGTIHVQSTPGKGSLFTIRLPVT